MDGLTCYTYKQLCDANAFCASDHRDEMGCKWNGFPGMLLSYKLMLISTYVIIIFGLIGNLCL